MNLALLPLILVFLIKQIILWYPTPTEIENRYQCNYQQIYTCVYKIELVAGSRIRSFVNGIICVGGEAPPDTHIMPQVWIISAEDCTFTSIKYEGCTFPLN